MRGRSRSGRKGGSESAYLAVLLLSWVCILSRVLGAVKADYSNAATCIQAVGVNLTYSSIAIGSHLFHIVVLHTV